MADDVDYKSVYRRIPMLLGSLTVLLAVVSVCMVGMMRLPTHQAENVAAPILLVATLAVLGALVCAAHRTHHWIVLADSLLIEERPSVRLTGISRRAVVPFAEIAAISRQRSLRELHLEIVTRRGATHRIASIMRPGPGRFAVGMPDVDGLEAFAAHLRAAIARAGVIAPTIAEGLSFWNRPAGLAALGMIFLVTLALSGVTVWAVAEGAEIRAHLMPMAILFVLSPVGAWWWLRSSWRRRREVLARLSLERMRRELIRQRRKRPRAERPG